ncbi:hypothetical protein T265_02292 [Opisthorchis viverrini]|uniref:Uncharacterized protein n=1 Tax=Opisthorchis viverrini TaxID=6198 RepID=A0A075AIF1_OPIVI|nr:hypothetical protein T265_02292 [Opisthorchis viverrini]KER31524.1 hypothetical protein T265_02292 [Opisthorchis viverrini]
MTKRQQDWSMQFYEIYGRRATLMTLAATTTLHTDVGVLSESQMGWVGPGSRREDFKHLQRTSRFLGKHP